MWSDDKFCPDDYVWPSSSSSSPSAFIKSFKSALWILNIRMASVVVVVVVLRACVRACTYVCVCVWLNILPRGGRASYLRSCLRAPLLPQSHYFLAPSSKLCQNLSRHWRDTLHLRTAVHRRCQRPLKSFVTGKTVDATQRPSTHEKNDFASATSVNRVPRRFGRFWGLFVLA